MIMKHLKKFGKGRYATGVPGGHIKFLDFQKIQSYLAKFFFSSHGPESKANSLEEDQHKIASSLRFSSFTPDNRTSTLRVEYS